MKIQVNENSPFLVSFLAGISHINVGSQKKDTCLIRRQTAGQTEWIYGELVKFCFYPGNKNFYGNTKCAAIQGSQSLIKYVLKNNSALKSTGKSF